MALGIDLGDEGFTSAPTSVATADVIHDVEATHIARQATLGANCTVVAGYHGTRPKFTQKVALCPDTGETYRLTEKGVELEEPRT